MSDYLVFPKTFLMTIFCCFLTEFLVGCFKETNSTPRKPPPVKIETSPLVKLHNLKQDTTTLSNILKQKGLLEQMKTWRGNALFVKVDETKKPPKFSYYYYNSVYVDTNKNNIQDSDDAGFFNPASTVKVGISALVLEKLNQMNLSRVTEYRIKGTSKWYPIDGDIRRTLILSDNESANRLILFLGFEKLNQRMRDKGLKYFSVNRLMLDRGTRVESPPFELRFNAQIRQQSKQSVSPRLDCFEVKKKVGNCSTANDLLEIFIIFAVTPPEGTARARVLKWMNQATELILRELGRNHNVIMER